MPLSKGQTITDVNQHLKDMFPTAFAKQTTMKPSDVEVKETLVDDHYESMTLMIHLMQLLINLPFHRALVAINSMISM